jgi:phosphopantothenoylcysteine decarboxylase/phosphopantothenate--cysteine ligase
VTLLLGPVDRPPPAGVEVHRFESTADLMALLEAHFPRCDALVMAAAVADYRPKHRGAAKLERSEGGLTLELESTPDLVARCAAGKRADQLVVGFALESPERLAARAREKLARKGLDAIVANPLQTMGAEGIDATLITAGGETESPGPLPKADFARWLIEWIESSR